MKTIVNKLLSVVVVGVLLHGESYTYRDLGISLGALEFAYGPGASFADLRSDKDACSVMVSSALWKVGYPTKKNKRARDAICGKPKYNVKDLGLTDAIVKQYYASWPKSKRKTKLDQLNRPDICALALERLGVDGRFTPKQKKAFRYMCENR